MNWLRKLFCIHSFYQLGPRIVEGAALGWGLRPTRQFGYNYKCHKCGSIKYRGGLIIVGDRRLNPEYYNNDGWPIDQDGRKLPIAE